MKSPAEMTVTRSIDGDDFFDGRADHGSIWGGESNAE
jgi:hypothetical protein